MRKLYLKLILSLSLGGVLLLGGGSPLHYLQRLKSLNLLPKNPLLKKQENLKIHSLPFQKYTIISNNQEVGYLLTDSKEKLVEFSLPSLEKMVKVKSFPRLLFFLNSHATASASLLAWLGFRGKEPEKVFIASINVFIEKCLCDLPNKPLVYDIKKGLEDFAKYKGKNLEVKEVYRFGSREDALAFYKKEIDAGRGVVVSFVYDKEGKNPSKAKLREESTSYLGIGYLQLGTLTFLILYDGHNILAKSYEDNYANLIVLGARAR